MKRILIYLFIALFASILTIAFFSRTEKKITKTQKVIVPSPTPIPHIAETYLFVPYWNLSEKAVPTVPDIKDIPTTPRIIYFGITANTNGVNKFDEGYKNLETFSYHPDILTLRLLDGNTDAKILQNKDLQEKIIQQTIDTAKKYSFQEILLDFEFNAIPFETVQNSMSDFFNTFSQNVQTAGLQADIVLYGDQFYRHRPYNIPAFTSFDRYFVMFYDLNKPEADPGPNFPLFGQEKYGADLHTSLDQFLQIIPTEKVIPIFGMYGYDWVVNENKKPLENAKALPLKDIRKAFLDSCEWKNCLVNRDSDSHEREVDYIDKSLLYHVVWFDDEQSVSDKIEFVKSKNITQTAFWTWGYY